MADNYKSVLDEKTITGVLPMPESVLMKLQATCIFIKKRLRHWCFSVNFAKSFGTSLVWNICEGLLLRSPLLCVNKKNILDHILKSANKNFNKN